jgi:hypothetical protein
MALARRLLPVFVVLAASLADPGPAPGEWFGDVDAGTVYEDNLSRAAKAADQESDLAFASTLSVGHVFALTGSTAARASLDIGGSAYTEFGKLNNLASGFTLSLRHKLGLGPFVPWMRVFASGAYLNYADDFLDSALWSGGLEVGKRVHERIDLKAGYLYEVRDANNGVYDQAGHTLSLQGSFLLTPATELTLGYWTRWGDFTVHRALGPPPARPVRVVDTFDRPLFAFRVDATTFAGSVKLSHALTDHASLSLAYEYEYAVGPRVDYPNNVVRAGLSLSY